MNRFFNTEQKPHKDSKFSYTIIIALQIVFAATVTTEVVTGSSLFGKVDLQGIEEAAGASVAAVALAAAFAWFTSARARVGRIFTGSCNAFIDGLIDQIVDGLFYDSGESDDWPSDDV